jgi:hypothetical protein
MAFFTGTDCALPLMSPKLMALGLEDNIDQAPSASEMKANKEFSHFPKLAYLSRVEQKPFVSSKP